MCVYIKKKVCSFVCLQMYMMMQIMDAIGGFSTFHACNLQASQPSANISSGFQDEKKSEHKISFKNSGQKRFQLESGCGLKRVDSVRGIEQELSPCLFWMGGRRVLEKASFRLDLSSFTSLLVFLERPRGNVQYNRGTLSTISVLSSQWEAVKY